MSSTRTGHGTSGCNLTEARSARTRVADGLDIATIALDPVIEETVALTSAVAQRRRIAMWHDCHTAQFVRADLARVRRILLALLSNAVKFNREGGQVNVICETDGDLARIIVADTGPGIPPEMQSRLFQPMQRMDVEDAGVEGTGIGLAVCKDIAEAMGGKIGFDSEAGVGSRFWLELPLIRSNRLNDAATTASVAATATATARKRNDAPDGRVLYVEDNLANISLMEDVFRQLPGTELRTARSAEDALALIRENPPDLVLMDISLPGMSGLALLKMMKIDPRMAAIPVIAVSAAAMPQDVQAGLEAGFLAYLTKPVDVIELMALTRKILHHDDQI